MQGPKKDLRADLVATRAIRSDARFQGDNQRYALRPGREVASSRTASPVAAERFRDAYRPIWRAALLVLAAIQPCIKAPANDRRLGQRDSSRKASHLPTEPAPDTRELPEREMNCEMTREMSVLR
jgi:hypothetical protein